jgi:PTH1 family peptidyl-tRNA hydrolase
MRTVLAASEMPLSGGPGRWRGGTGLCGFGQTLEMEGRTFRWALSFYSFACFSLDVYPFGIHMKLIVGLGNPGAKYEGTRHNAGFRAVRAFHTLHAEEFGGWAKKFSAEVSEGRAGGDKVVLMLPQTYMNDSGEAVVQAVQFWKVSPADVLVVYDEIDIPLGNLRIRTEGSAGGHNGMKSIIERLGTMQFPRIRIGIGTERLGVVPLENYVLEKFSADEEATFGKALDSAVKAIDACLEEGPGAAQNKFGK